MLWARSTPCRICPQKSFETFHQGRHVSCSVICKLFSLPSSFSSLTHHGPAASAVRPCSGHFWAGEISLYTLVWKGPGVPVWMRSSIDVEGVTVLTVITAAVEKAVSSSIIPSKLLGWITQCNSINSHGFIPDLHQCKPGRIRLCSYKKNPVDVQQIHECTYMSARSMQLIQNVALSHPPKALDEL